MKTLHVLDQLLRNPRTFAADVIERGEAQTVARHLVQIIVTGCALFGVSVGLYRGGLQVAYAAIKFPLVMLLTAGITTPAVLATRWIVARRFDPPRDVLIVLSALALISVVAAAETPVLLLAILYGVGYHPLALVMAGLLATAAAAGLWLFVKSLDGAGRGLVTAVLVVAFCVIGSRSAWVMRPWLVRPKSPEPEFIRAVEGDLIDALGTSMDSTMGHYERDSAPLPRRQP